MSSWFDNWPRLDFDAETIGRFFAQRAIKSGTPYFKSVQPRHIYIAGDTTPKQVGDRFCEKLKGARQVYVGVRGSTNVIAWETGVIWFSVEGSSANRHVEWTIHAFDKDDITAIEEVVGSLEVDDESTARGGRLSVVAVNGQGHFYTRSLGVTTDVLIRGNYEPKVVYDLDHVVKCLKSSSPCGRFVLLDGPAGVGKSFALRGIMSAIANATFVFVPSNMVEELAGPRLMPLIADIAEDREDEGAHGPVILILEDADGALLPRASDNMGALSTVLNLTDGLIGSLCDVRVLATTNAKLDKLDPALTRAGRLCRRIEVGKLNSGQALNVFKRLTDRPMPGCGFATGATLADIYKAARND